MDGIVKSFYNINTMCCPTCARRSGPNVFLRTLFPDTCNLCSFAKVRNSIQQMPKLLFAVCSILLEMDRMIRVPEFSNEKYFHNLFFSQFHYEVS
jgi:hypothetical protein